MSLLIVFLMQAVGISLSGVLAPGPMTAATLAAGARSRHAGLLLALGHGIVEFPLMLLIMAGMGKIFQFPFVQNLIGFIGGGFLIYMAVGMFRNQGQNTDDTEFSQSKNPLLTGIILTAGNPYFLLWWATIGLALASQALQLGPLAFAIFAVIHWLCDLVWLEILSQVSFRGRKFLGPRSQERILLVCGIALLIFGIRFVILAGSSLAGL
jgi:threonine/homoserine/homoserine lactone efflux protein